MPSPFLIECIVKYLPVWYNKASLLIIQRRREYNQQRK